MDPLFKQSKLRKIGQAGFDNYYKIAERQHVCAPKFWHMRNTWAKTKKQISGVIPFT